MLYFHFFVGIVVLSMFGLDALESMLVATALTAIVDDILAIAVLSSLMIQRKQR